MADESVNFTMPSLGADMDEGKLVEWLVKPGDTVSRGDIVAVVETAKATIEVECFHSGLVRRLLVGPGTTVPVGTTLAELGPATDHPATQARTTGDTTPPPAAAPAQAVPLAGPLIRRLATELGVDLTTVHASGRRGKITRDDVRRAADLAAPAAPAFAPPVPPPPPVDAHRRTGQAGVRISPYAERLAAGLGVDPATVHGTGRGGAVRADDVRAAAVGAREHSDRIERANAGPRDQTTVALDRAAAMRQVTARLMARSKREIPHYYLSTTIDVTDVLEWLRDRNRRHPVAERILPAALFLQAVAAAAVAVPQLNGTWTDTGFVAGESVDLGVAVAVRGGGLVTPTIVDAARLDLDALMARLRDVATRAKAGRLRGLEVRDATLTVTNLGDLGVETVYGVIYPPQVALVGIGKIVERPWAVDGMVGARSVATITLSADHRATDGHTGARFLEAMGRLLVQPDQL